MAKGCTVFLATVGDGVGVTAPQEVEETGERGKVLIGGDTSEQGDHQYPLTSQCLFPYQAAAGEDDIIQVGREVKMVIPRFRHDRLRPFLSAELEIRHRQTDYHPSFSGSSLDKDANCGII